MTEVVASWTGGQADALRQALRMTNESFAERLGIGVRTVAYWRNRPDLVPRPAMQEILDAALARAPEPARALFLQLTAEREHSSAQVAAVALPSAPDDFASLKDWLTQTDTSDEAISSLDRLAAALAEAHTQVAPATVLAEVRQLQHSAQNLLRSDRQRPSQTRELLRINGSLLAHQSLLLSDLKDYPTAENCGYTALLCQREAGASQVTGWYVLAKAARWQRHYLQAADLARQGLQHSSPDPMRVQLACYEANASALLGDIGRARKAMRHAEETATACPPGR